MDGSPCYALSVHDSLPLLGMFVSVRRCLSLIDEQWGTKAMN